MEPRYREHISNEEVNELPLGGFEGRITVVDTPESLAEACTYLSAQPIIGFDTETRPSFTRGVTNKVSLLQLSSGERAFLFRLNKVAMERPLLRLLESPDTLKVGAAIRDDIRGLQKLRHFSHKGFLDLQSLVGEYGIAELSVRKMAAIVLEVKVSKAQRLSNWEAVSLTPAQQLYAATDAWISREIYVQLKRFPPVASPTNKR